MGAGLRDAKLQNEPPLYAKRPVRYTWNGGLLNRSDSTVQCSEEADPGGRGGSRRGLGRGQAAPPGQIWASPAAQPGDLESHRPYYSTPYSTTQLLNYSAACALLYHSFSHAHKRARGSQHASRTKAQRNVEQSRAGAPGAIGRRPAGSGGSPQSCSTVFGRRRCLHPLHRHRMQRARQPPSRARGVAHCSVPDGRKALVSPSRSTDVQCCRGRVN